MFTNQEVNQELERMFKAYGIEFNDFGFTNNMDNNQYMAVIRERELDIIETINDNEERSFEAIETIEAIETFLNTFKESKNFIHCHMLGDTRKVYNALFKNMPKDHTVKTWLGLHLKWAGILEAI